jgi:hypothetical protein
MKKDAAQRSIRTFYEAVKVYPAEYMKTQVKLKTEENKDSGWL